MGNPSEGLTGAVWHRYAVSMRVRGLTYTGSRRLYCWRSRRRVIADRHG